ncbi:hypothetical protein TraAM80_09820 [Trypanosoma rangeli]|uniref:Uncharacterized protein n=1 Tax=Trypanosoma rangeli TaxID=5698 RepID=A0A3R7M5A8_TRYRA|nr:uncharacterized protein TraAM80_09820 [Trypanosoma rangeli]RNE96432.1 hypothetical protein TraAM80_09820 [Trypanosoma rangeli]|eukprot:RNE96432.1 hypothetical protein TraAM80_09820 [Trypanosoma rangeli]
MSPLLFSPPTPSILCLFFLLTPDLKQRQLWCLLPLTPVNQKMSVAEKVQPKTPRMSSGKDHRNDIGKRLPANGTLLTDFGVFVAARRAQSQMAAGKKSLSG